MMNYQVPTTKEIQQAASIGISKKLLDQRLRQGWTMERAITAPVGTSYEGQEKHAKMQKLAKKNGISITTFYRRLKEGYTPYQAATTQKGFGEFAEIAESNGISRKTFYKRVERGMEIEEAATKPTQGNHGKWTSVAMKNGIGRRTFYYRLKSGWSYETAATKPSQKRKQIS